MALAAVAEATKAHDGGMQAPMDWECCEWRRFVDALPCFEMLQQQCVCR